MALVDEVTIMGSGLNREVREAITDAAVSAELGQVMQLDITVIDQGWKMLESGLFKLNMRVEIDDLKFEIANITTGENASVETIELKCRPRMVRALKNRRGTRVMRNTSPSEFVIAECKAVGASFVVQPSAKRAQVARDVVKKGEKPEISNPPSSFTTFQRLARELGFIFFESGNVVFFAKPTWLLTHPSVTPVPFNYKSGPIGNNRTLTVPACTRSEDDPAITIAASIIVPNISYARPGKKLVVSGVPTFNGEYLVTSFSANLLDDPAIAEIAAGTPLNPAAEGVQTGSTTTQTRLGTRQAGDFIYWVQKQIGDKFVTGTQVDLGSSDPNVFDGSELVQWASAQVGVFMPDLPLDQINYCANAGREISVTGGLGSRGAILWTDNRIDISLGGSKVVGNVNGRVGITRNVPASRYKRAGLIPGVSY